MRQISKRFLSLLIALTMVLTLMPAVALATGSNPFTDVKEGAWYFDAVQYVKDKGLMQGTAPFVFSPDMDASRGMIVTILHRLEGKPAVEKTAQFSDVPADMYYADGVAWAEKNGIVNGYGDGRFGPNDSVTRDQLTAILYRYVQYKGMSVKGTAGNFDEFTDTDEIAPFAVDALKWAVSVGLIKGMTTTTLEPRGTALRSQLAMILYRLCEGPLGNIFGKYIVTFDWNYGNAGVYKTVHAGEGKPVEKPDDPVRVGYSFGGWYTEPNGGHRFNFDTAITEDLTLYADWNRISSGDPVVTPTPTYTVTIEVNDPAYGSVDVTSVSDVPSGTVLSVEENVLTVNGTAVTATANEGYRFVEWTYDSETVTGNVTVTANFEPVPPAPTYTVTIEVNDPTYGSVDETSISGLASGTAITVDGNKLTVGETTVTATASEGYQFVNWTIDGTAVTAEQTVTDNVTVTANFEEIKVPVTITFDANGGSGTMEPQQVEKGVAANLNPCAFEGETKYHTFTGWNTEEDGSGDSYADGASITTTEDVILYAQWAEDVLRKAVDEGVATVSGETATINANMSAMAGNAKLNEMMQRVANYATKLANLTNNTTDNELVEYVKSINWEEVSLAADWIGGTADTVENDATVNVTLGGKVVLLAGAGVPYAAIQNAESYGAGDLLASIVNLGKDMWLTSLKPVATGFQGISDTVTVTYKTTAGETITVKFEDVDGLYTELKAKLDAITAGNALTQEQSTEIVNILKAHIAVPTHEGTKALLKMTYAAAQDMIDQAVGGTVNAALTVEFDILDACAYKAQYMDGTFENTYTLNLTGNCHTEYNEKVYDALITVKEKVENSIDKITVHGSEDVIYGGSGDLINALIENYDKVRDGVDVYATAKIPARVQTWYADMLDSLIGSVKTKITAKVDEMIGEVDIESEISSKIDGLGITDAIKDELDKQLADNGLDATVGELTLADIGFDTTEFAAALKNDFTKWWQENGSDFVDDVLTGEKIFEIDENDKVTMAASIEKLADYLGGDGSEMRKYLKETVKPEVENYVEEQLKTAITAKVKETVEKLNEQIDDVNAMLGEAETAFEDANTQIKAVNQKLAEMKKAIQDAIAEDPDLGPEPTYPQELPLCEAPNGWTWSVEPITADGTAEWTWDETKAAINEISAVIAKLDELKTGCESFAAQKETIANQITKNAPIIDELSSSWGLEKPEMPNMDAYTVPALTEDQKSAIDSAKEALDKLGDLDAKIEKAVQVAGDKFTEQTSLTPMDPETLTKLIAPRIQEKLEENATYTSIKDLLPLEESLALDTITINTIGAFKAAAGVDLDEIAAKHLSSVNVVNALNRAAAALKKLPESATVNITVDGTPAFTNGTVNAGDLANALEGADLDTIYDNLCSILTNAAKDLSIGDFAGAYKPVEITVTGGKYSYPVEVYLELNK